MTFALRTIARYVRPHLGRFTPRQLSMVAELLNPPAYLAVGPVLILLDLPKRFQKQDPEEFDFAAHLAEMNARQMSN